MLFGCCSTERERPSCSFSLRLCGTESLLTNNFAKTGMQEKM